MFVTWYTPVGFLLWTILVINGFFTALYTLGCKTSKGFTAACDPVFFWGIRCRSGFFNHFFFSSVFLDWDF